MFSAMVPNYRWPQTQVNQRLGEVEAYFYASIGIHPRFISDSPSLPCVRWLLYVARRKFGSFSRTYVSLLSVLLALDSVKTAVCKVFMRPGRTSALLRPPVLVAPRHHLTRTYIRRQKIQLSVSQLGTPDLKHVFAKSLQFRVFFSCHVLHYSLGNESYLQ